MAGFFDEPEFLAFHQSRAERVEWEKDRLPQRGERFQEKDETEGSKPACLPIPRSCFRFLPWATPNFEPPHPRVTVAHVALSRKRPLKSQVCHSRISLSLTFHSIQQGHIIRLNGLSSWMSGS